MATPQELLADVRALGVHVWREGLELRFSQPDRLTEELRAKILDSQHELIHHIPPPLPPATLALRRTQGKKWGEVPEAAQVRHLLFHLYPLRGDVWRWHASMLRRLATREAFNGRRILALMQDEEAEDAGVVRAELSGLFDEIIELPNDFILREVASFAPLFSRVQSTDPGEATLYAHGKGVFRLREPNRPTVQRWTEVLYETCIGAWQQAQTLLRSYPIAGPFFKLGRGWSDDQSFADWHYSGSWLWYRNRDVFSRPDWRRIDRFVYGIETWPALHFAPEEAGRLFFEGNHPEMNLYDAATWNQVERELVSWQDARRPLPDGLWIELGGGTNPRRDGDWINVDIRSLPGVDHVLDFESLAQAGREGGRLPFADASVAQLYSAHCFEHVHNQRGLLHEIARVCKVGARVTIHVPHWNQSMAMCFDHKLTISERQVRHWCEEFVSDWWTGSPRRFQLRRVEYVPGEAFAEAKRLFPQMTDDQVMRFAPGACHEIRFTLTVVPHEG